MYLRVADGRVDFVEPDNFRAFKLVVVGDETSLDQVRSSLAGIAVLPDPATAWVDADALRGWAPRTGDQAWQNGLSAMIEKARPHGWIHPETGAIKAHVEWQTASAPAADLQLGLRQAMRRLASTVTIITTVDGATPHGMTATAVMSLSLEPPSLVISVNRSASLHDPLLRSGIFCVNLLKPEHQPLCAFFSGRKSGAERFGDGDWAWGERIAPYLADAQASIFCQVDGQTTYGTHTIIVGRVTEVNWTEQVTPLLHQNADYGRFEPLAGRQPSGFTSPVNSPNPA